MPVVGQGGQVKAGEATRGRCSSDSGTVGYKKSVSSYDADPGSYFEEDGYGTNNGWDLNFGTIGYDDVYKYGYSGRYATSKNSLGLFNNYSHFHYQDRTVYYTKKSYLYVDSFTCKVTSSYTGVFSNSNRKCNYTRTQKIYFYNDTGTTVQEVLCDGEYMYDIPPYNSKEISWTVRNTSPVLHYPSTVYVTLQGDIRRNYSLTSTYSMEPYAVNSLSLIDEDVKPENSNNYTVPYDESILIAPIINISENGFYIKNTNDKDVILCGEIKDSTNNADLYIFDMLLIPANKNSDVFSNDWGRYANARLWFIPTKEYEDIMKPSYAYEDIIISKGEIL